MESPPPGTYQRHASTVTAWFTRHEIVFATLVLALVLSIAFREVVFGGKTLLSSRTPGVMGFLNTSNFEGDQPQDRFRIDLGASAWQTEPIQRQTNRAYRAGHMPLWNPNAGAGGPLLADMISAPLNLVRLPVLISTGPLGWDVYLLGRFLLGGLATFVFARLLKMSLPAALVTSVGYMLSGHFMLYSNELWLEIYYTLPLILLASELCVRHARPVHVILLAVAVALNLYAGMPEATFVTLLLAGSYAAYRVGYYAFETRAIRPAALRLACITVGFAAGFTLSAPLLLPFLEYVGNSHSIHVPANHLGLFHDPFKFSITLILPHFNGSADGSWWGRRNYVGIVVAFLAILGLWHRPLAKQVGWFFLLAAFVAVAKTYGFKGINELGRLPFANVSGLPEWLSPVIAFPLVVLAGLGADRLARKEKLGASLHIAAGLTILLLVFLLLVNREAFDHLSGGTRKSLLIGGWMFFVTWIMLWMGEDLKQRNWLGWGCFGLVTVELLLFAPAGIYRPRADTFEKPPYISYLQDLRATEPPFRIFGLDAILFPDDASAYNLQDPRTLNAMYPDRYITYIQNFVAPTVSDRFVGGPYLSDETVALIRDNPMFDILGVKYVMTSPKIGIYKTILSPLISQTVKKLQLPNVDVSAFSIGGAEKPAIFTLGATEVPLQMTVTPASEYLMFSVALDPATWSEPGGSASFQVAVKAGAAEPVVLYNRTIDPKGVPADRRWFDDSVDLTPYSGQAVTVLLRTLPSADRIPNRAGWGDVRFGPKVEPAQQQYVPVYDKEVRIYQNQQAAPRALVLHRVEEIGDSKAALARLHQPFEPRRQAVIEGKLPDAVRGQIAASPETDGSSVRIASYTDNRVKLQATMEHAGLVVLTDTYFPGWKVKVDGKSAEIYATDYLFRGVVVGEGQHEIEFTYAPAPFKVGLVVALLSLLALGGWWGFDARKNSRPALIAPDGVSSHD